MNGPGMLIDGLMRFVMQLVESTAGYVLVGCAGALIVILAIASRSTMHRRLAVIGWAVLLVSPAVLWSATGLVPMRGTGAAAESFFFLWSVFGAPSLAVNGTLRGLWPAARVGYRITLHDAVIVFCSLSFLRFVCEAAHV